MKKTLICAASLISVATADMGVASENVTSYLSNIHKEKACNGDIIVLRNGSKFCGKIERLPALPFAFKKMPFKETDLAFVLFLTGSQGKAHYVTRDGHLYTADLPLDKLVFNDIKTKETMSFDPLEIEYIVFKEKNSNELQNQKKTYSLELKDGNRIPVILRQDTITVSDGIREHVLSTDSIIRLVFAGGVHGYVRKDGRPQKINLSFVKDRYLAVQICHSCDVIKFPCDQIIVLQEGKELTLPKVSSAGAAVAVSQGASTLDGAFGAVAVSSEVFTRLDDLAFEHPMRLYHEEEIASVFKMAYFEHLADIAFENAQTEFVLTGDDVLLINQFMVEQDLQVDLDSEIPDATEEDPELGRINFISLGKTPSKAGLKLILDSTDEPVVFDFFGKKGQPSMAFPDKVKNDSTVSKQDIDPLKRIKEHRVENSAATKGNVPRKEKPQVENSAAFIPQRMNSVSPSERNMAKARNFKPNKSDIPVQTPIQKAGHFHFSEMVYVASQPSAKVLEAFYVDQHPVTNSQYKKFVEATHYHPPLHWHGGAIPPGLEFAPVVNISYKDAMTYAVWAGKRLPTESELLQAARMHGLSQLSIFEWTASSTVVGKKKQGIGYQYNPSNNYKEICNLAQGKTSIMYKHDFNNTTGFRCALDAP